MQDMQALSLTVERIEAQAFADVYRAVSPSYASANMVQLRNVAGGACLTHGTIVIPELNRIVGVSEIDDIEVACDWMGSNGVPGWVVQMPPTLQDATRHLELGGYRPVGNGWAKFYREAIADETPFPSELTVRTVDAASARTFAGILSGGFGLPLDLSEWLAAVVGRPNWTVQLAFEGSTPVSCGALYSNDHVGWMGMDATLPDHRGKGGQSLLIRSRVAAAAQLGLKGVTVETGQPEIEKAAEHTSFSNYQRAGFTQLYTRPNFSLSAEVAR